MKLYGCGNTPNPRKVKIVLAEKAIDYEMIELDLQNGEHKAPEFLQKNPLGRVPVLGHFSRSSELGTTNPTQFEKGASQSDPNHLHLSQIN